MSQNSFFVPKTAGIVNVSNFFGGKKIRMDKELGGFFTSKGRKFHTNIDLSGDVLPTHKGWSRKTDLLSVGDVCALLRYLGLEGWEFLEIPEGKYEVEIVLGRILIEKKEFFLRVEHELEPGRKEEVHLHVKPIDGFIEKVKPNLLFLELVFPNTFSGGII
jgi:hypothetical protein